MSGTRWRYPDVGLEPDHVAYAREFVDGLPYRDRIVGALVSGSRAAGLAHRRSDLDVIVVVADEDRGRCRTMPKQHRGMTVDADTLTIGDLHRHLANQRAREAARVLDRRLYALADYAGWSALVRLAIGHVVTATPPAQALLDCLDRGAVRRSVMVHGVLCLATFAEDAKGSMECGDLATALSAAEEAVRHGVEVSLAALDDLYIGRKYLLRRMARHASLAALVERCDSLLGPPAAECPDDEVERLVRWRLLLAGHLAGHALSSGWQRPAGAVPPFAPGRVGPMRDPYLTPVRWPGGLGLMTGVDVVRSVPDEAVVMWNLLDGRRLDDVVDEFARLTRRDISDARGLVRRTVDAWRRAALVHDPA